MATIGQVQRGGPATKAVAAEDQNAHRCSKVCFTALEPRPVLHSHGGRQNSGARLPRLASVAVYRAISAAMLISLPLCEATDTPGQAPLSLPRVTGPAWRAREGDFTPA